jgi:hypothetical protein
MVDGRPGEAGAITDPEAATGRDRGARLTLSVYHGVVEPRVARR